MAAAKGWAKINHATVPKGKPLLLRMGIAADEIPIVGAFNTQSLRWLSASPIAAAVPISPIYFAEIPAITAGLPAAHAGRARR